MSIVCNIRSLWPSALVSPELHMFFCLCSDFRIRWHHVHLAFLSSRFRQEYREERRLRAQEESDTETSDASTSGESGPDKSIWDGCTGQDIDQSSRNHRISRVVILHKNTLETFFDEKMNNSNPSDPHPGKCKMASDDFFDNDSFWSGQITWY